MKSWILIIIILALLGGPVFFIVMTKVYNPPIIEPIVRTTPSPSLPTPSITPVPVLLPTSDQDTLKRAIEQALEGTKGTYGIVIKNLKTGESYSSDGQRSFQAGSLYKIWIMATAFDQIQNGQLTEDEVLRDDIAKLNETFHIDPETAELTEGTITLSIRDAMEQMITISHNYAALLLSQRIMISSVSTFLADHNLHESTVGEPPMTTPSDIALFFEDLYRGKLANEENSRKMMDLLTRQKLNNKLPKYLPKDVSVAHKTGEIGSFTHDAGIVFGTASDYIIIILSESDSPYGAEERIAGVSKAVYDYFERK